MMKYKGYYAKTEVDEEAGIIHGEVITTQDVVTFHAESVKDLFDEFKKSIDVYLDVCKEYDKKPEKPFTGDLRLRMPVQIHKGITVCAQKEGKSLNKWINEKLEEVIAHEML
jgi:predicted HicB family RNase H-like nuclease